MARSDNGRKAKRKRCGAKTKKGKPCKTFAMENGRCRLHGGLTPFGPALPQFKTGRYSTVLPGRMNEMYLEVVNDKEILSLREEIGISRARLADLLKRVDSGEAGDLWTKTRDLIKSLESALQAGDPKTVTALMQDLSIMTGRGSADWYMWREVMDITQKLSRLIETERRRLEAMQQMMSAEQVQAMLTFLLTSVNDNVSDRKEIARVYADARRFINRDN